MAASTVAVRHVQEAANVTTRAASGSPDKPVSTPLASSLSQHPHPASEPLKKPGKPPKLKYVPGGPGGGGRWFDTDGKEHLKVFGVMGGITGLSGEIRPRFANVTPIPRIPKVRTPKTAPRPSVVRSRRERIQTPTMPRFNSSGAAAAAAQEDGYKPREEKSWEEYHPELDIQGMLIGSSKRSLDNSAIVESTSEDEAAKAKSSQGLSLTSPGPGLANSQSPTRNPALRRTASTRRSLRMSTPAGQKPRPKLTAASKVQEKLTLPKPCYRLDDPYAHFEAKATGQAVFVDKKLADVGYQESDHYIRHHRAYIRDTDAPGDVEVDIAANHLQDDSEPPKPLGTGHAGIVKYDMDEQDKRWLEKQNAARLEQGFGAVSREFFEITMTRIEKEWSELDKQIPRPAPKAPQTRVRSNSAAAVSGDADEGEDSKCAICDDGDCENLNAIVFCDGCDLAVHQECYGVPYIPEGSWLCRKCQQIGPDSPVCIFCPIPDGAFKQTDSHLWAHLLCSFLIPDVVIGNWQVMEPIMETERVQRSRFGLICYICKQRWGAPIQCAKRECTTPMHVTCARKCRLLPNIRPNGGTISGTEFSQIKTYCHRHQPINRQKEHDFHEILERNQMDIQRKFRGKVWQVPGHEREIHELPETPAPQKLTIPIVGQKRKRDDQPKSKLPSGAPIVPQFLHHSTELSVKKFLGPKSREFTAELCKYWTLKRESRRGAALIKSFSSQNETSASLEMARRDFRALGAAGGPRLKKRIDFAKKIRAEMEQICKLTELTLQHKEASMALVAQQQTVIESYFPVPTIVRPILETAEWLASKGNFFSDGLAAIREKMDLLFYDSVTLFAQELISAISFDNPPGPDADTDIVSRYREVKATAIRIGTRIQPLLADAYRKENEIQVGEFDDDSRIETEQLLAQLLSHGKGAASRNAKAISMAAGNSPSKQIMSEISAAAEESAQTPQPMAVDDDSQKGNAGHNLSTITPPSEDSPGRHAGLDGANDEKESTRKGITEQTMGDAPSPESVANPHPTPPVSHDSYRDGANGDQLAKQLEVYQNGVSGTDVDGDGSHPDLPGLDTTVANAQGRRMTVEAVSISELQNRDTYATGSREVSIELDDTEPGQQAQQAGPATAANDVNLATSVNNLSMTNGVNPVNGLVTTDIIAEPASAGRAPWYMHAFSPNGTSLKTERLPALAYSGDDETPLQSSKIEKATTPTEGAGDPMDVDTPAVNGNGTSAKKLKRSTGKGIHKKNGERASSPPLSSEGKVGGGNGEEIKTPTPNRKARKDKTISLASVRGRRSTTGTSSGKKSA